MPDLREIRRFELSPATAGLESGSVDAAGNDAALWTDGLDERANLAQARDAKLEGPLPRTPTGAADGQPAAKPGTSALPSRESAASSPFAMEAAGLEVVLRSRSVRTRR
jgi:hypothetical protein